MNQGIKQVCRKLIIPCLSLPILSMPILGCDTVFQVSGSHILKACCHQLQVFKVHEEYQSGLSSRIVFDQLKQRAQSNYLRATVHSLFLGPAPFLLKNFYSGSFLALSLMPGFICYFLKLLNILVVLKGKYLLLFLKKRIMVINYHGPRHKIKAYDSSS